MAVRRALSLPPGGSRPGPPQLLAVQRILAEGIKTTTNQPSSSSLSSPPSSSVKGGRKFSSRLVSSSNHSGEKMMMWKRVVPASTRILDFLGQELGTEDQIDSCLQLLRYYTQRGDLVAAEDLASNLRDKHPGNLPLRALYTPIMLAYCKKPDLPGVLRIKDTMTKAGLTLTKEVVVSMLECCGESGPAGIKAGISLLSDTQSSFPSDPDISLAALELLSHSSSPSSVTSQSVEELWAHVAKGGGPPSVRALSARLQALACASQPDGEGARALIQGARELVEAVTKDRSGDARRYMERGVVRIGQALAQCPKGLALVKEVTSLTTLSESSGLDLLQSLLTLQPSPKGEEIMEVADLLNHQITTAASTSTARRKATAMPWILPFYITCLQPGTPLDIKSVALKRALEAVTAPTSQAWLGRFHEGLACLLEVACEVKDREAIEALRREAVPHAGESPRLIRALIQCAAQEGRAGKAMSLLRRLDVSARTKGDYDAVLRAVEGLSLPPVGAGEKEIVESPLGFLTWLMEEMKESGAVMDVTTLNLSIRALETCCVWHNESGEAGAEGRRDACVNDAVALVNRVGQEVRPNEDTFLALIGVAVRALKAKEAQELLTQLDTLSGGKGEVLAKAYCMLVQLLAVGREDVSGAEEVFVAMTTKGIMPTSSVMDAFVHGYCKTSNIASGLSMIQSCYNQYNSRPSLTTFTRFIELCLTPQGPQPWVDIFEAQRGFIIAEQLWTLQELVEVEPLRKRLREEEKKRGL